MAMMQGKYTADGTNKYLEVPFDANWIKLFNFTQWDAGEAGDDQNVSSYWQNGMDYGIATRKNTDTDDLESYLLTAANAITSINTGDNPLGTAETHTGITNAAPPVMTVADTTLYPTGSIVRLGLATGCTQIQNLDFTVQVIDGTTMRLINMVAPGDACAGGTVYPLKWDGPWYPRNRYITSISQAAQAVIKMTVTHEFAVGDTVRLMVPDNFGMVEANLKEVKITAVDTTIGTNTITVDLDTTSYTAYAWPATGGQMFELPQVIPVSGPITNTAYRGFKVVTGAANPGGVDGDVIYWVAGDSFGI